MQTRRRIGLGEVEALVRAVAMDESLHVVAGDPGGGWRIHADTGAVVADPIDLEGRSEPHILGLAVHEAAHASITRYPYLLRHDDLHAPGRRALLNALEDCRIEGWMMARFAGVRPWVKLYNDALFPLDPPDLAQAPLFRQFCLGCIYDWWHGAVPQGTDDRVLHALVETSAGRSAAVEHVPAEVAHIGLADVMAYEGSPVQAVFRARHAFASPDVFERVVRMSAYRSLVELWQRVRPVYDELIREDLADGRAVREEEGGLLRHLREVRMQGLRRTRRLGHDGGEADAGREPRVGDVDEAARRAVGKVVNRAAHSAYEAARRDVEPLVQRLVNELERVLRQVSYPRWVPGYISGARVDLRGAMQLEADPSVYDRLWQRKTLPRSFDPCFLLLLDLSGSMDGSRIEHGFRGVVLLCEVLAQLSIPFAVCGFQDVLLPFKELDVPLDEVVRQQLGGMPSEVQGARRAGHNRPEHNWDGPALEAAAQRLVDYGARDSFLLVVSDGEPSGPGDGETALHRAVRRVQAQQVHLVGVGLGPGTEHVGRYYPEHLAEVPLEAFPASLGRCLEALLRPGAGERAMLGAVRG